MTSQDQNTASSTFYILAAHGGAGFHPSTSDSSLKCSLRESISSALTAFSDATTASGNAPEPSALDAATTIIAALEDAPDFNAGYGSNLTFDGDVECDASLMSTEDEATAGAAAASPDRTLPPLSSSSSSYSFGSVGAVRGVHNPVLLARRVLEGRRRRHQPPGPAGLEEEEEEKEEKKKKTQMRMRMMRMGRVPPLMLVGEGALQFAREQGLRVLERSEEGEEEEEQMVSPRARREWLVWRERWDRCCRLDDEDEEGATRDDVVGRRRHGGDVVGEVGSGLGLGSSSSSPASEPEPELELGLGGGGGGHEEGSVLTPRRAGSDGGWDGDVETLRARQDTVGAVVLVGGADDVHRQVAAGVSSGGLLLKHSGRVGEAAVFGAGCWAEQSAAGCRGRVACSVSGQGELIVQSLLAKTLAERIAGAAASTTDSDDDSDDNTHDILRSVLVDEFYGASPFFFFFSPSNCWWDSHRMHVCHGALTGAGAGTVRFPELGKWHQRGEHQPAVGVLLITQGVDGHDGTARLWCAFTTQSMAVAYASSRHPKPKATVLRNTAHDFHNDNDGRPPLFITTFSC